MYHNIKIIGHLGKNPEMRYLPDGKAVTNMSVASNRSYQKDGEWITETTWFSVTVWGDRAEACNEKLEKGFRVFVEGYLNPNEHGNPRIWTRNDGTPASSYEMTAQKVLFLDKKEQQEDFDF